MATEALAAGSVSIQKAAARPLVRIHAVCALIVLVVLTVGPRLNDPDLWWHLKLGQVIWDTHTIPDREMFSFTAAGHPWIAHEWLAQVALYAAYHWGGYTGLMVWLCLFASLLVVGLYGLCALYSGDHFSGLLGAALGWFFGTMGYACRPQLLGYLFLLIELLLLHLGRTRDRRWLWGLPGLFAGWVNVHGSFSLGLVVLAAAAATAYVRGRWGRLIPTEWEFRSKRWLLLSSVCCLPALVLNPAGLRGALYPLNLFTQQKLNLAVVSEWSPLTVDDWRGVALVGVLVLVFGLILLEKALLRADELLFLAIGTYGALLHSRLVFAFGMLAAPAVARIIAGSLGVDRRTRNHPAINGVFVAVSAGIILAAFPTRANLEGQVRDGNPEAAVSFIRKAGLVGPLLNDYDWGGYLLWALPEHRVFIDGRCDVYEWSGVLAGYGRWISLRESPRQLPDKYGARLCLLSADRPIAQAMALLPEWKEVYRDNRTVVLVRTMIKKVDSVDRRNTPK